MTATHSHIPAAAECVVSNVIFMTSHITPLSVTVQMKPSQTDTRVLRVRCLQQIPHALCAIQPFLQAVNYK